MVDLFRPVVVLISAEPVVIVLISAEPAVIVLNSPGDSSSLLFLDMVTALMIVSWRSEGSFFV